jgi:hypothetical protein
LWIDAVRHRGPLHPKPIVCPFPDIAGHVVEAIAIGWKTRNWGRPSVAILLFILEWKLALPGIRFFRRVRIPPGKVWCLRPGTGLLAGDG